MIKRKFLFTFFAILFLILPSLSLAVSENNEKNTAEEEKDKLIIKATANKTEVLLGEEVNFDGQVLSKPEEVPLKFMWDFGDGKTMGEKKAMHIYEIPGQYKASLTAKGKDFISKDEITVNVYSNVILLVADKTVDKEQISLLKKYAQREDVMLVVVQDKTSEPEYIIEANLVDLLVKNQQSLKEADIIISWTSGNIGLNALSKFYRTVGEEERAKVKQKAIVSVIDKNFTAAARITQPIFDIIQPEYILLTKKTALHSVINAKTSENVIKEVRNAGVAYHIISFYSGRAAKRLGLTNFMSYAVNYLINKGITVDNIFLILILPIIATFVAFMRQFLGIKTFGIYTPTIITLSFLATGLKYGLAIFVAILIVATLVRLFLRRFRLLYLPRMAILLTVVAFVILAMFLIGVITGKTGMIGLSIFPILVLVILTEKFIAAQIEKGAFQAFILTLGTVLVSIVCYFIAEWDRFKTLILAYPELVILTLFINIFLGKWVGLRISEYFRFRELRKFRKSKT